MLFTELLQEVAKHGDEATGAVCAKLPQDGGIAYDWLTQLAEVGQCPRCSRRVRVQQDRLDHSLHVAPDASRVAVKCSRDSFCIGGRWVGGHQPLNELLANERSDIGMIEQVVDRSLKVLHTRLPGRHDRTVQ